MCSCLTPRWHCMGAAHTLIGIQPDRVTNPSPCIHAERHLQRSFLRLGSNAVSRTDCRSQGDFGLTRNVALVTQLTERDQFIVHGDLAGLAKIAPLNRFWIEHGSSTHHILRDVNTFTHLAGRMCELLHTGFAKTRHAMVRPFGGSAPLRADNWTSRPAPASNPIALSIGSVGAAIPRYPMTGIAV